MLEDHSGAQPPPIKGSVMLATAGSQEEVLEKLKADVYAKEVWDLENVQIIPVSGATILSSGCGGWVVGGRWEKDGADGGCSLSRL